MRKILYAALLSFVALFLGCEDELPQATFGLYEIENFSAKVSDSSIELSWQRNQDKLPDQYLIKWSTTADGVAGGSIELNNDVDECTIDNLTNDVTYTFSIQGRYSGRLSAAAKTSGMPKDQKFKVEDFIASAGDGKVRLTWAKPDSKNLTGYIINYTPGAGHIEVSTPQTERYIIDNLTNGTEYTFSVCAVYTFGQSVGVTSAATPGVLIPIFLNVTNPVKVLPVKFTFNDMYFIKSEVQSVSWDFGDGSATSAQTSPLHGFATSGNYEVTATVTYTDNSTESGTINIAVSDYNWNNIQLSYTGLSGYVKVSNPVFSPDGLTLYVPTSTPGGHLFAVDVITGACKWAFPISSVTYGGGAMVGDDGTIYQGAEDKVIYAINPNGSQRWKRLLKDKIGAFLAMGANNTVYCLVNGSTLYALNGYTGAEIWSSEVDKSGTGSAVLVGKDDNIYVGTSLGIYCYSSAGSQLWASKQFNVTERGSFAADGTTLYATLKAKGGLVAINMNDGTTKWHYPTADNDSYFPVVDRDGSIYFVEKTSKKVFAVNADGSTKWTANVGHDLIYNGLALGENGVLYCGTHGAASGAYKILGLNSADGTIAYNVVAGHIQACISIGPDNRLYSGVFNTSASPNIGFIEAYDIGTGLEAESWSVRGGDMQGTNRQK